MKKIYTYVINFALLCLSSLAQGIFYNATEFVSVDGSQTIICLGDCHNLCEDAGVVARQQNAVLAALKDRPSTVLVVEDPVSLSVEERMAKSWRLSLLDNNLWKMFRMAACTTPLQALLYQARHAGIVSINAECRLNVNYLAYPPQIKENYEKLTKEVLSLSQEMRSYNDSKRLNEYYAMWADSYSNMVQGGQFPRSAVKKGDDDIWSVPWFVDAKILHAIHQNKDKKYIVICAGANHTDLIADLLPGLGYSKKNELGISSRELDKLSRQKTLGNPADKKNKQYGLDIAKVFASLPPVHSKSLCEKIASKKGAALLSTCVSLCAYGIYMVLNKV